MRFQPTAEQLLHMSFDRRFHEETALQRIDEALAIYFHALEFVLLAEKQRLNGNVEFAPKLLAIDSFHKSLLLCAVETVCASYGIRDELHFDRLLTDFELSAFEFIKVINSFVMNVQNLPPQAKRRLAACQECVLNVLAWSSASPLVTILRSGRGESESVPAAAMDLFFNKLLTHASQRILCLCYRLGIQDTAFEHRVWSIFKYALAEQWEIFVGRNVDAIILCAVYSTGKVIPNVHIKFSDIIAAYKCVAAGMECVRLCDSLQAVFRDVALDDGERGDVIAFYNLIFIPHMKRFLLGGENMPPAQTSTDAAVPSEHARTAAPQQSSPVSSPGPSSRIRDKIVSSPLRAVRWSNASSVAVPQTIGMSPMSPRDAPPMPPPLPIAAAGITTTDRSSGNGSNDASGSSAMTPATRQLYSFGSSPLGRRRLTFS